jgi:hypothetical protein
MMATPRPRLFVEELEAREVPDGNPIIENFDSSTPPALPSGWGKWSSDGTVGFDTAASQGVGGSVALQTVGNSNTAALAWYGQTEPGDSSVSVSVHATSLIPTFVFARGSNLNTSTPSYLAAIVTRGVSVQLIEVTGGNVRVLGTVSSPSSSYLSGPWLQLSLQPTGNSVVVQVQRTDTGQYLNSSGTWQTGSTTAIAATTSLTPTSGSVGVGRMSSYAGTVSLDNFTIVPPAPSGVTQSFDTTAVGAVPTGWQTWSSGNGNFATSTGLAESGANGFASTGGSNTSSRAWSTTSLPADVDASAAVYLNSLIPAQVFIRGSNLNTATPTYYAATITRGLTVQLEKVVNGVKTTLGSVTSSDYISSKWVRVRIVAQGNDLQVSVYRADTAQWLSADGTWSNNPDVALDIQDSSITAAGLSGLGREAVYGGTVTFDDFDAHPASADVGPQVTITPLSGGNTVSGTVTFQASATGNPQQIQFLLNNVVQAVSPTSPASWTLDSTTLTNGTYTLVVRAYDAVGNVGSASYTFTVSNQNATPIPTPTIPRHYPNIRIAELAYSGNPMGSFEQNLLQNSVDLVIPNPQYLSTIHSVAPNTPQLVYTNFSNLYQGLLTSWLNYAAAHNVSPELAFYHVTQATPFSGGSASSQPVDYFWGVYQTASGGTPVDQTSAAYGGRNYNLTLGGAGTTTSIGYPEPYREINVSLIQGAASGWSGQWQYVSAVDANGNPTAWKPLSLITDGTSGLKQSGQITFDPPSDWVTSSIGGSVPFYYVRFVVNSGTAVQGPTVHTILGRDYVGANGTQSGVIPAFDYSADTNHDGYLNNAEYANRKPGMNARFVYESRLFYPYYGQMRFVTNPSSVAVRQWAASYAKQILGQYPLASGIFLDNSPGKLPFSGTPVLEPTSTYGTDYGALVATVSRALAPNWVLANTAGGGSDATPVSQGAAGSFEEFLLRPLQATWSDVGDVSNLVNERLNQGSPYLVIDSYPGGGSPTDPRTQIATLAYYYLVGDPVRTFLMFYGGYNPSSSWTQHWSQAATVNIGTPTDSMRLFATGQDPENTSLTYKVFARDYTNGMVLYKPLSYTQGVGTGTTDNSTATTLQLGGSYRVVNSDGTLGAVITSISLRNGEGAVLVKA